MDRLAGNVKYKHIPFLFKLRLRLTSTSFKKYRTIIQSYSHLMSAELEVVVSRGVRSRAPLQESAPSPNQLPRVELKD